MNLKELSESLDIQEEIISSKGDDSDTKQLKDKFDLLNDTGKWTTLSSITKEFFRRRENKPLIDRMGENEVRSRIARLFSRDT